MIRLTLSALGIAIIAAGTTTAQSIAIDSNGDGVYSMAEMLAFYPDLNTRQYNDIDTDGDGIVTLREFKQAQSDGKLPYQRDSNG